MYSHLSSNIRTPVLDSGWINVPRSDIVDVKRVDESRPPSLGLLLNPNHQTEYYDRVAASLLKIPTTSFKHSLNGVSADQFTQTESSHRTSSSGHTSSSFAHSKGAAPPPVPLPPSTISSLEPAQCNMNTKATSGGVMANPGGVVIASSSNPDDKCYRLDMCGQQFSYNYALMNQMSFPYKCDLCGVAFVNSSVLNQHKRIHTDKTFACKCGAHFPSNSELKTHQATVHKETQESSKKECEVCGCEIINKPNRKRLQNRTKCQSCIDDYLANQGLKSSKGQRRPPNVVKKCDSCNGSGFIYDGGRSDKPFQCSVCDNTFSRYSSLWSHKRLHSGDKPYRCEDCGTGFAKAAYLKNHKRVHSGEKPFKCGTCGQEFSQGPHLKNHERIHTGERPYVCDVCGKRFSRHSTLWNHRRIHTGEKPYRCEVCGSSFSQGTHLKNHRKVHTGERPYRCDVCDVGFSDRFALKRHRNVHGGAGAMSSAPTMVHSSNQGEPSSAPSLVDLYKCEVGQVAFPGCARPSDDVKPIHT